MGNAQPSTPGNYAQAPVPKLIENLRSLVEYSVPESDKSPINIEKDCEDIRTAVLAARNNDWETVWRIIGAPDSPRKPYLINCIPETRRWGILHQAIFWNRPDLVTDILKVRGCDISLKAKQGQSEIGDAGGKDAITIANEFNYTEIAQILMRCTPLVDEEMDTFVLYNPHFEGKSHPLLRVTLALYRDTFCSKDPIPHDKSFQWILSKIFKEMEMSNQRWQKIQQMICDSLHPVSQTSVADIGVSSTREEFYTAIIRAYTIENSWLYAYINRALRRQNTDTYTPPADDLACGPYILMLYILMMFWENLSPESNVTYRKMKLDANDLAKYRKNTKFIWQAFTSSSVIEDRACSFPSCPADVGGFDAENNADVVFTIDNNVISPWNPRNIEKYAAYNESERVYPPGARFLVTDREEVRLDDGLTVTRIALKLLQN